MQQYLTINDNQIEQLYEKLEFPESVRQHSEKVVVIMTQDWCPQWHAMDAYLNRFIDQASIYLLIYNTRSDFDRIREFKEEVFNNREIPYIRYYYQGKFITETNYLPQGTFSALLTKTKPFKLG
jgi:hypothetical protein